MTWPTHCNTFKTKEFDSSRPSRGHYIYFFTFRCSHFRYMEFFEQGVCTLLESFPSIRQMKKEQSMIVQKIVEGRDVYAELPTGFGPNLPGVCIEEIPRASPFPFPFPLLFFLLPVSPFPSHPL